MAGKRNIKHIRVNEHEAEEVWVDGEEDEEEKKQNLIENDDSREEERVTALMNEDKRKEKGIKGNSSIERLNIKEEEDEDVNNPFSGRKLFMGIVVVFIYLIVVFGLIILIYKTTEDLVKSLRNPVRSFKYYRVDKYNAPGRQKENFDSLYQNIRIHK